MKDCPVCRGDGECATSHRWKCYDCDGTGKVSDADYEKLLEQERKAQITEMLLSLLENIQRWAAKF